MPPQRNEPGVDDEQNNPTSSPSASTTNDEAGANGTSSYWETAKESSLEGKTLSTLDFSAMEHNRPDEKKEKNDNYWEATPERKLEGKTLSTLDMSMLGAAVDGAESTTPPPPAKTSVVAEEPKTQQPSYWDAPVERSLQGKTLSTLDISALEKNNPDKEKQQTDSYWEATPDKSLDGKTLSSLDMTMMEANDPIQKQEEKDSYWESAPIDKSLQGKTLSTLDVSALETSRPDEKKETHDSYWDAPEESKLKGKTLSTIDVTTLETTRAPSSENPTNPSYWDNAPIDRSLQGKTLSSLDMSEMTKQHADDSDPNSGEAAPYWDWKVKAFRKTLSKLSLTNLRKGSTSDVVLDDDDCVHGASNSRTNSSNSLSSQNSSSSGVQRVKPITQKVHKIRNAWRKSFQHLSTNTLDQLDESGSSGPRIMGKRIFKSRNSLDVSGGSHCSTGSFSQDALMF